MFTANPTRVGGDVKYKASYTGIGEMLCAPWMEADMKRRAENVKTYAEATAPVGRDRRPTKNGKPKPIYKDSFKVSSGIKTSKKGTKRAYGRVTNDSPQAIMVEYGNENTPRHATLRKALEAVAGDD
jgi:hypothetical protein